MSLNKTYRINLLSLNPSFYFPSNFLSLIYIYIYIYIYMYNAKFNRIMFIMAGSYTDNNTKPNYHTFKKLITPLREVNCKPFDVKNFYTILYK